MAEFSTEVYNISDGRESICSVTVRDNFMTSCLQVITVYIKRLLF